MDIDQLIIEAVTKYGSASVYDIWDHAVIRTNRPLKMSDIGEATMSLYEKGILDCDMSSNPPHFSLPKGA